MKRFASVFLAGALVLALSACGGGNNQAQPEGNQNQQQPAAGGTTGGEAGGTTGGEAGGTTGGETAAVDAAAADQAYQANCAACHGKELEGVVGPKLSNIGSKYSKDDVLGIINNGKGGAMPGGLVKGADAENLAAWLAEKK
ncbi:c-type cytochrome [Brevibacillus dissolubilis]|uniref:c-type cytochrome n=1 Tax=Brevibacillus dissolubilis TaxID=1844116 RepID=UPI0011170A66|nr:cytochrome c [Brevibacillus dissolubilis]